MITAFEVSNVIMHIILISVFLAIFFFTYGAYLEKQIFKSQIHYLIDDSFGSLKVLLPENIKDFLKQNISNYSPSLDKSEDEKVEKMNMSIVKKASVIIGVVFVIGIIIITIITKNMNMENMSKTKFWGKLIKYNIIALVFIALTEFIFASQYARHFMSIDINRLKKDILNNLISKVN
jgi:hypothetical protein